MLASTRVVQKYEDAWEAAIRLCEGALNLMDEIVRDKDPDCFNQDRTYVDALACCNEKLVRQAIKATCEPKKKKKP